MVLLVIDETATTGADPAAVYTLFADGSTWPEWSPIGAFTLLEPGAGTPEGLGAVPAVHNGPPPEPRAGGRVPRRARPSPTSSRRGCRCGTTRPSSR